MSYDGKYKLPSDAEAVLISPSIVGDRFIQITPVYKGGGVLADNAHLGTDRTATPLELDQIYGSLNDLSIALGPQGANKTDGKGVGALTRLLDSTARNFGGQGVKFNETLQNLGKFTKTLADNKDELFGTARAARGVREDPGGERHHRPPVQRLARRGRRPARRRARGPRGRAAQPGHRDGARSTASSRTTRTCSPRTSAA